MRMTSMMLAVLLAGVLPVAAQSTEFGVLFGGSARSTDDSPVLGESLDDDFSLSNSAIDFYYGVELEPGTFFKIRVGRIETPVGLETAEGERVDVEGEVQHIDAIAEYRFSEPFGTAGFFGGIAMYRQTGTIGAATPDASEASETDYGFLVGITADFPLSRRYGVVLDATHHWTRLPFKPRFLTASAGLRIRF